MRIEPLLDRIEAMEADIATLREYGATDQAETLELACRRFRAAVTDWLDEALTITEADKECPWWKAGTLAGKIRAGELPQAGEHGAPLLRRRDLFGVTGAHSPEVTSWAEKLIDG